MANQGGSLTDRSVSFVLRLLVSLILPAWGLAMLAIGIVWGMGWWIATGVAVIVVSIILFCGSSLVTSFLPGGRKFG